MKLLLDTHIWLWAEMTPEKLTAPVRAAIENAQERWLSPVTLWESALLAQKGKLDLGPEPLEWLRQTLRESPMRDAPLTREVALVSRSLTALHEDPADRFLAATAMVHDLTLVTADRLLIEAPGIPTLANA